MAMEKYKTRITSHAIQGPIVAGNIQNVAQNFGSTEPGKTASWSVENSTQNALSKKEKEEQESFSLFYIFRIFIWVIRRRRINTGCNWKQI